MIANEKSYLDSLFRGVAVDSAPIKDVFDKHFSAKSLSVSLKFSKEQLRQVCIRFHCTAENFFMGTYALLLARFTGADEVLFTVTGAKKIPVYSNFLPEQNLSDYLRALGEQIEHSCEIISTPYEEIAKVYNFPNAPEFISTSQETNGKNFAFIQL